MISKLWAGLVFLVKLIVFTALEAVVPKRQELVLFAADGGLSYTGNSRFVFEHALQRGQFDAYWITRSPSVAESVEGRFPGHVVLAPSIRSLLLLLRAKAVVVSHGGNDVAPYYLSLLRKEVISVWHGTPIKRIGHLAPAATKLACWRFCSKIICSSELEKYVLATCFRIPVDSVWVTGLPRNDRLFECEEATDAQPEFLRKRTILYAPTFRDNDEQTALLPFDDLHVGELIHFLQDHDAYLLLRRHGNDVTNTASADKQLCHERIVFANRDRFPDVQLLLPYVDVLITDYSGIYFDFLLLDRPIIFVPYDLDDYEARRGFLFDYHHFTPGPKVVTQKAWLAALQKYLADPTLDSEWRNRVRHQFHRFDNGRSCERVVSKMCGILDHDRTEGKSDSLFSHLPTCSQRNDR